MRFSSPDLRNWVRREFVMILPLYPTGACPNLDDEAVSRGGGWRLILMNPRELRA